MMGKFALFTASILIAGCASTSDREQAYQSCRWEKPGPQRDACIERHVADAAFDRHQAEMARIVHDRAGDHRQSVCMANGGSRDDCERTGRDGPAATAPPSIEVELEPVYQAVAG